MIDINKHLSPIEVNLDQLLLDPNNPRFADFEDNTRPVPDKRVGEDRIQHNAFERMKSKRFDVAELRDTIKAVGYLPMDRIVIREYKSKKDVKDKKYVVVEGNRRITALKWLIELEEDGRETFGEEQIENFTKIPALLLDDEHESKTLQLVLPGLRHVSGIKDWGPYQRARAVHELRKSGFSPQESAQSLGLSTQAANRLWRSYLGLEQMRDNEEFGEFADPDLYSFFEEIIKSPKVRTWLSWDDDEEMFKNEERTMEMYNWMVGELSEDEDSNDRDDPKLPEAKSIRQLGKIIDDNDAFELFRRIGGTLTHALSKYEAAHPEAWQGAIVEAKTTLEGLTPDTLRSISEPDIEMLEELLGRIKLVLKDRENLLK